MLNVMVMMIMMPAEIGTKQKRRNPNGSIVLYNISDVINY